MAAFEDTGDGFAVSGHSKEGTGVWGIYGERDVRDIPFPPPPALKTAVRGFGDGIGVSGENAGNDAVTGRSFSAQHSGVWGDNQNGGIGVAGSSKGNDGVVGKSDSAEHSGVGATIIAAASASQAVARQASASTPKVRQQAALTETSR
jgi:hypothetical protein